MTTGLLESGWTDIDPAELRFILFERIGRPGQYHDRDSNPNAFYLPLAGSSCQIKLTFSDSKQIVAIERGPAFDAAQWQRVVEEIERTGPPKVGRDCSFSSFRVAGSWRGKRSGVQILPPPPDAPQAPYEMAEHPFILEYPLIVSDLWPITNFRRMRKHRQLTLLLNVLLAGTTTIQPRRSRHLWAIVPEEGVDGQEVKWVQEFYFGKVGEAVGETVFYTGVVGYQEVITDPSYAGTLTTLTYPIIGSYGVNDEDNETPQAHPCGVVIKEYSRTASNFRSTGTLDAFLIARGVVGIRGVDTRALAVHLRDHGEMKGMIVSGDGDAEAALSKLKAATSPWGDDLLSDLSAPEVPKPEGKAKHRLTALNAGVKRSTLASLAALGCAVRIVPASTTAQEILKLKTDGLLLSGGPGDPNVATGVVDTVKTLLGKTPIFGVGLGHQILALALGCTVERMKVGHHGVNHSVKRTAGGRGEITVQHHSFVVDKAVPGDVSVTHVNVNDGTIEGIRSVKHAAASVQFHPSCDDWGRPNKAYSEFLENL